MDVLDRLLFNLRTIATIPKGRKISTAKEFITVNDDSLLQPILRWKSGDGRDKAVQAICREVRTTIAISNYILESRFLYADNTIESNYDSYEDVGLLVQRQQTMRDIRISELKKIKAGLSDANNGIDNLCETYNDDANVLAYLNQLMSEIDEHVNKIRSLLIQINDYDVAGAGRLRW